MSQDPEQIRQDIEATRRAMDATLDQIEDRVAPRRIVERKADQVREMWADAKASVLGTVDDAREAVGGAVGGVEDEARARAQDARSGASGAVEHSRTAARRQVKGNPLAAGLIAFGIGALAGSLLPGSRAEERAARRVEPALGPAREGLAEAGAAVAHDVEDELRHAADEVAGSAQEAADAVRDDVAGSADRLREDAEGAAGALREEVGVGAPGGGPTSEAGTGGARPQRGTAPGADQPEDATVVHGPADVEVIDEPLAPRQERGSEERAPAEGGVGAPAPAGEPATLQAAGMEPTPRVSTPTSPDTSEQAAERPYDEMTVEELLEVAGDRDITGRWSMNKDELIAALREGDGSTGEPDYGERTVEELRHLAAERDVHGRSSMTKDELVAALSDSDGVAPSRAVSKPPAQDRPGRHRGRFEDRTVEELRHLAAERDIPGRSSMTKDELIAALRR